MKIISRILLFSLFISGALFLAGCNQDMSKMQTNVFNEKNTKDLFNE